MKESNNQPATENASDKVYESHGPMAGTQLMVLSHVPRGGRVLEFGCATGYMTRYMKEQLGCSVTAVEISPEMARQAMPFADKMVVGNAESDDVWDQVRGGFDCAVFADVLEHLANPWTVLGRTRNALVAGGIVVASVPNIAYYKIRKHLLLGGFDYTDYGILDNTHLRFFTRKTAVEMFESCGYDVPSVMPSFRGRTDRWLHCLCPGAFSYQYVIRGEPRKNTDSADGGSAEFHREQ